MACRISRPERVTRGTVAALLGAFAVALTPTAPIAGIASGLLAVAVAVMTVTGWCGTAARTGAADTSADADPSRTCAQTRSSAPAFPTPTPRDEVDAALR